MILFAIILLLSTSSFRFTRFVSSPALVQKYSDTFNSQLLLIQSVVEILSWLSVEVGFGRINREAHT